MQTRRKAKKTREKTERKKKGSLWGGQRQTLSSWQSSHIHMTASRKNRELKALQTNRIKSTWFKVDFSNLSFEKNAFFTKRILFKPEKMLSFIENCRDVTFSKWLLTFMLPLISAYGNAPELKALQTNRIKCTFFKVDFTNVSFKKMHFARNIQYSNGSRFFGGKKT